MSNVAYTLSTDTIQQARWPGGKLPSSARDVCATAGKQIKTTRATDRLPGYAVSSLSVSVSSYLTLADALKHGYCDQPEAWWWRDGVYAIDVARIRYIVSRNDCPGRTGQARASEHGAWQHTSRSLCLAQCLDPASSFVGHHPIAYNAALMFRYGADWSDGDGECLLASSLKMLCSSRNLLIVALTAQQLLRQVGRPPAAILALLARCACCDAPMWRHGRAGL
jgi:hypothetical protein